MEWIMEEFKLLDLGDERLNKRAKKVLTRFSQAPDKSIPSAHNGWAETKAAYRFMSNKQVSFKKLLGIHRDATLKRIEESSSPAIIVAQDTSELDYGGQGETEGRGPTNGESHPGVYLHPLLALTESGLCLGVLDAQVWHREELGKTKDHCKKAIEEKESFRWLEELREVNKLGELYPKKQFVMVADREADIAEVLAEPLRANVHYVIRGHHNRRLLEEEEKLLEHLKTSPILSEIEFELKERGQSGYRTVIQEIRVQEVTIKGSPNRGERTHLQNTKLTAILATEKKAGKTKEKLEWLLLTNRSVEGIEDVLKIIGYYLLRWKIEIYFKVLKSGCQVEELQLEGLDRLCNCLALYMIVAWRVMYLVQLGRDCPDLSCEVFFEEEEWRTAYLVRHRKPSPQKPPTLNEMIRVVASIGGFLERKSDGDPGPKHLWIGIQRIKDFVYAINIQNEVFGNKSCG